ncbi:MAG: hypothetical protein A2827_02170 [Candidatus Spechtbacteria bacterium RIFCSPHIGHO2_01_FULL_43_30]|uniref:Glycosyltransferase 2-like domain-containing protein n=1 Tax=Candidatus Spechtbacteria bacterium RIFCSPHIGHO2_01_FULL_43_30 TaxID=1802158 RepID=A0A1G2H422_9BACT|nr:MAG: hypothetical protein A2827_02170 [Candidatus Spechtbacteria bacterium RIFCSPHIGHO2_01_FULL_43_30]
MPIVTITIAARNEEKNIEKSLSSALNQSYSPIEVFLIDDLSSDKTSEVARNVYRNYKGGAKLTIVRNEKNLGFGGSHNKGMSMASGEFILCLNADCELDKNYVKYAVESLRADNSLAGIQGKLFNPRTNRIDTAGLVIFRNRRSINRGQGEKDEGQYEKEEEVWGIDGAAPVYRKKSLESAKIGNEYFDEDFFAYKEDVDLSWRMRLFGWKFIYQPKCVGYHDRSAGEGTSKKFKEIIEARKKISDFAKIHSFTNQRLMEIKNETPRTFLRYALLIFVKEAASWSYVINYEKYGWKSAVDFFRLCPRAWRKRKYVMANKKVSDAEIGGWFC